MRTTLLTLTTLASLALASAAYAETQQIAVAASMVPTMEKISADYEAKTGHHIELVGGASGKLSAQIEQGAPFTLFLGADDKWPKYLHEKGLVTEPHATAEMPLRLWAADKANLSLDKIKDSDLKIAIADPESAPFGNLARKWLTEEGIYDKLVASGRLVIGGSVSQTAIAASQGGADLALLPESTLLGLDKGSYIPIPAPALPNSLCFVEGKANDVTHDFWKFANADEQWHYWKEAGYSRAE